MRLNGVSSAAISAVCLACAARADLTIEWANISFDPNAGTWYVSTKVCNGESGGHSGSISLELRLVSASGSYYAIGAYEDSDTIDGGYCLTWSSAAIDVSTNVPGGEYDIALAVGDWQGGRYVTNDTTTFDRTFISGGFGSGRDLGVDYGEDDDRLGLAKDAVDLAASMCGSGMFFGFAASFASISALRIRPRRVAAAR